VSKDTKLIMENWRGYVYRENSLESLFERQDYITNVLGIALPINESGVVVLNEELKQQILEEHLIFEKFIKDLDSLEEGLKDYLVNKWQTLKTKVKGKAKKIISDIENLPQNFKILKQGLVNLFTERTGTAVEQWIKIVNRQLKENLQPFFNILKKAKEKFSKNDETNQVNEEESEKGILDKIEDLVNKALNKYKGFENSWKKCLVGSALVLLITWIGDKLKDGVMDLIKEVFKKIVSFFSEAIVAVGTPGGNLLATPLLFMKMLIDIVEEVKFVAAVFNRPALHSYKATATRLSL